MNHGRTGGCRWRLAAGVPVVLTIVPCVALLTFSVATIGLPTAAYGQQRVPDRASYAKELALFDELAIAIEKKTRPIEQGLEQAVYSREILDEVKAMYDMEFDEPLVTSHCRNWVYAQYRDMFPLNTVDREGLPISNADRMLAFLDAETADYFSQQLTEMMRDAHSDLSTVQRKRMVYFVGHMLSSEDTEIIRLLGGYLSDATIAPDERDVIFDAIVKITRSPTRADVLR